MRDKGRETYGEFSNTSTRCFCIIPNLNHRHTGGTIEDDEQTVNLQMNEDVRKRGASSLITNRFGKNRCNPTMCSIRFFIFSVNQRLGRSNIVAILWVQTVHTARIGSNIYSREQETSRCDGISVLALFRLCSMRPIRSPCSS